MPVFHFDVHHGSSITIDDEGLEVSDVLSAEKIALEVLGGAIWTTRVHTEQA